MIKSPRLTDMFLGENQIEVTMKQIYRPQATLKTFGILLLCLLAVTTIFLLATPQAFAANEFQGKLDRVSITDAAGVNAPPKATFTYIKEGDTFTFDASKSIDSDGSIFLYKWNFGSEAPATGPVVTHDFPLPGTYPVTLTIVDDKGAVTLNYTEVNVATPCNSQSFLYQETTTPYPGPIVILKYGAGGTFINNTNSSVALYSIVIYITQFSLSTDHMFTMRIGANNNPSMSFDKEFDFTIPQGTTGEFEIIIPDNRPSFEPNKDIYWFISDKGVSNMQWTDRLRIGQSTVDTSPTKNIYSSSTGWAGFIPQDARWHGAVKICD